MGQVQKNGFLIVSKLETSNILETSFTQNYFETFISWASVMISSKFNFVTTIDKTPLDHIPTTLVGKDMEENSSPADDDSCVVAQVTTLLLINKKTIQVRPPWRSIQLIRTNGNSVPDWVALAAQCIGDTILGMPFFSKTEELSPPRTPTSKVVKVSSCLLLRQS